MNYFAFSNNGLSWRGVFPEWELFEGEILFDHWPSDEEIIAAFPNFVPKAWRDFQQAAREALFSTDMVAIRCFKAGIAFPPEWWSYVEELRLIIRTYSGDVTSTLPVKPEYPAGS